MSRPPARLRATLFFAFLTAASAASAEPLLRLHSNFYYIDGASAAVLAGQIDQSGPAGADGARHPSKTKWEVNWNFKREQEGEQCRMGKAMVAAGISQTFPRWRGEAKAPASLRQRWGRFSDALRRHEDRHKDHAAAAAREIERAIAGLPPASNCEALEASANAAAEAVIAKYRKMDLEYDRQTAHGRSEGARLLD